MAEIGTAYVDIVPRFAPDIPRIQILELPMEHQGEYTRTPFVFIIDGLGDKQDDFDKEWGDGVKEATGASAVLLFRDRVQV